MIAYLHYCIRGFLKKLQDLLGGWEVGLVGLCEMEVFVRYIRLLTYIRTSNPDILKWLNASTECNFEDGSVTCIPVMS